MTALEHTDLVSFGLKQRSRTAFGISFISLQCGESEQLQVSLLYSVNYQFVLNRILVSVILPTIKEDPEFGIPYLH